MTTQDVRAIAGRPVKTFSRAELLRGDARTAFQRAWIYRDASSPGGYTYVNFNHSGHVALIQESLTTGNPIP